MARGRRRTMVLSVHELHCLAFATATVEKLEGRSWLLVGRPLSLEEAAAGFDVVILKRGKSNQPGPDVIEAPGHVGLFAGREGNRILVLGGNQSDAVNVKGFPANRLLGIRRLV